MAVVGSLGQRIMYPEMNSSKQKFSKSLVGRNWSNLTVFRCDAAGATAETVTPSGRVRVRYWECSYRAELLQPRQLMTLCGSRPELGNAIF